MITNERIAVGKKKKMEQEGSKFVNAVCLVVSGHLVVVIELVRVTRNGPLCVLGALWGAGGGRSGGCWWRGGCTRAWVSSYARVCGWRFGAKHGKANSGHFIAEFFVGDCVHCGTEGGITGKY